MKRFKFNQEHKHLAQSNLKVLEYSFEEQDKKDLKLLYDFDVASFEKVVKKLVKNKVEFDKYYIEIENFDTWNRKLIVRVWEYEK